MNIRLSGLFLIALLGFAVQAQAVLVDVYFQGIVDGGFEFDSDGAAGGGGGFGGGGPFEGLDLDGSFTFDSDALVTSPPGEYVGAVFDIYFYVYEDLGGGNFGQVPLIENELGDIFVGTDSIEWFFGPSSGQLGNNFNLILEFGPTFNNSLADATNQMLAGPTNVVNLFGGDGFGIVDNDQTFGNMNYTIFYMEMTARSPGITGDLDGNGFVGIDDLNIVLSNWNQSVPPANPLADPSGDGFVGIDDLNAVLGNWNAGTPPAAASVPEPASFSALMLGLAALAHRRRRPA